MAYNNWEADLAFGQAGEFFITQLGSEASVEVKRDRKWHGTGNIFFELSCSGKPSGVMSTEATYFAYILSQSDENNAVFIWKTSLLRPALMLAIEQSLCRKVRGGDGGRVEGLVFPLVNVGELTKLCKI